MVATVFRTVPREQAILSLAFWPDGRHLLVGHDEGVTLVDVVTTTAVAEHAGEPSGRLVLDGRTALSHDHGSVTLHSLPDLLPRQRVPLAGGCVRRVVASRDGRRVAVAMDDDVVVFAVDAQRR